MYVVAIREIVYDVGERSREERNKVGEGLLGDAAVLSSLISSLAWLSFEAKQDAAKIFKFLFLERKAELTAYFLTRPLLLAELVNGYQEPTAAHACGTILRQCIRQESLCDVLMHHECFNRFFEFVTSKTFELASDAFSTFALVLTYHKKLSAAFLLEHYDAFLVERWNDLLMCRTYVTKRQALKIIRDILTERTNFKVMMKYVTTEDCLQVMIALITGKSVAIKNDAFHVFKIFVLNPRKTEPIIALLCAKKPKLLAALQTLNANAETDKVASLLEALTPPLDR
jgi:calcium binding protein 39